MSRKFISRLQNWKFVQACEHLDGQPEEVQRLVQALARLVGDCGWGLQGDLATVIDAAVASVALDVDPSFTPARHPHA